MLSTSYEGELKLKDQLTSRMPRRMELPPVKEITTTVSKSGTGAHVFVPKEWLDKKVKVTLIEDE